MGGINSGWFGRRTSRPTTDDYLGLDVRRLARESLLTPGCWFTWTWTQRGNTVASIGVQVFADRVVIADGHGRYSVRLEWTPCGFGGRRVWFRCPRCGRRCCLLYHASGFPCQACLGLTWPVEREARGRRALRRAEKILRRAKVDPAREGWKPKWQRWPTHARMTAFANEAAEIIGQYEDRLYAKLRKVDAQPRPRGRPPGAS